MLCRTFTHASGIGETTEKRLWASGVDTWERFLQFPRLREVRSSSQDAARRTIEESIQRFETGDWRYFDRCLSQASKWRAFGELGSHPLFFDIETDGSLSRITVLGLYDGQQMRSFVAGRNLQEAAEVLESSPLLVSYNGACFDLPIILREFPHLHLNAIHIDLLYPLRRLGFRGGLKGIETQLGIDRSEQMKGLSGWDAVRLWADAESGNTSAMDTLLAYNAEDVIHLELLLRRVYQTGWNAFEECVSLGKSLSREENL